MGASDWLVAVVVASIVAVVGIAPASATQQGTTMISKAMSMCEASAQGGQIAVPADAGMYFDAPAVGQVQPLSALPDLIKRYAQTGPYAAAYSQNTFFRFSSKEGEAWSIVRDKTSACDVVVTGFHGSQIDQEVLDEMSKAGWTTQVSRAASAPNPLSQYVLIKMLPASGDPKLVIRAHIKSLGFGTDVANGVQMEINFVAGHFASKIL